MEMRHGRHRDHLHMSPYKLALIPQGLPTQYKHYQAEIIAAIDVLVWRGQVVGGLAAGVTAVGLSGKNKRAGQEPGPEDTGLIQILLARLLIRDLLGQRSGDKVDPRLRSMYSNILKWESQFPAEATLVQASQSNVTLSQNSTAWIGALPEKNVLWKSAQHDLVDGECNE